MSKSAIDANNKPTMIGVSSVDNVTPTRCTVDPVTGYLLANIVDTGSAVSPVVKANASIDVNGNPTMLGWNATTKTPQALITHNGYLALQAN